MDQRYCEWKSALDRIWSAAAVDYGEAARLAAEIAGSGTEVMLRQAATQALPILRSAAPKGADQSTQDAALRRLRVVREVLSTLTTPQFGKRQTEARAPTPEERYRAMLGLPLGRLLSGVEIHQAWKRAAKRAHPDGGGSARQFQALSAAREALLKLR